MSTTTLSIQKHIYQKAAKRAKQQHLSVSAIARLLLNAYAEGRIDILAVQMDPPVELEELDEKELSPEILKTAQEAYNRPRSEFINIPV